MNKYRIIKLEVSDDIIRQLHSKIKDHWKSKKVNEITFKDPNCGIHIEVKENAPYPNWMLNNLNTFRETIYDCFNLTFNTDGSVIYSKRSGVDFILTPDELKDCTSYEKTRDVIISHTRNAGSSHLENYRILLFNVTEDNHEDRSEKEVSLIESLAALSDDDFNDIDTDPFNKTSMYLKTAIKQPFRRITLDFSSLGYHDSIPNIDKVKEKFKVLESSLLEAWIASTIEEANKPDRTLLLEDVPVYFAHYGYTWYEGKVVDSFAAHFCSTRLERCPCPNSNCGALNLSLSLDERGEFNFSRYLVIDTETE